MIAPDLLPMISSTGNPQLNLLLAGLRETVWDRAHPQFESVYLPAGTVLYEANAEISKAYFPTTAIVSLQAELASGACVELAVVGKEGLVGSDLVMGAHTTSWRAIVDRSGTALSLKGVILQNEFCRCAVFQGRLLRCTQALITQIAQTVACNSRHSMTQRICRWLAGRVDRQNSPDIRVTHETIAARLGVRRESVSAATAILQRAGVIRCGRGHILVLDRRSLEEHCCECYAVLKQESDRLLHFPIPSAKTVSPQQSVHAGTQRRSENREQARIPNNAGWELHSSLPGCSRPDA